MLSRRQALELGGALSLYLSLPGLALAESGGAEEHRFLKVRDKVPDPENIFFEVQYPGKAPLRLAGHFWFNAETLKAGTKCPAIVEFNPYRRRDGTMIVDAKMYPWFAYNDYLCFRVDLQGSGDSEGVLTDEYTDEELAYCVQVIGQIAAHPNCTGAVGMMGKSWSAINSLMVSARADRPEALKAIIVCAGSDDRWNDDVHYMGGAMMFDNVSWPSSMFGWVAAAPDPAVVGDAWREMWRTRIDNADFWFRQWGGNQPRDDYWSAAAVRDHYGDVGVPVFILSGWQDGYKNPVEHVISGLSALGKESAGLIGAWGHKYPFNGYPGPRVDWLDYILTHWWDRWLKGKTPPSDDTWPQLPVWLGVSKEPSKSACADEIGKWVAEDSNWRARVKDKVLYLGPGHRLGDRPARATYNSTGQPVLDTEMLETSSWGECGNDDLPGDQARFDRESLYFDSDPLADDLDCFGYPEVALTMTIDRPIAALAIRLLEVSPATGASHLVTYRFVNPAYRGGDTAKPRTDRARRPVHLARAAQPHGPHLQARLAHPPRAVAVLLSDAMGGARRRRSSRWKRVETGGLPASALTLPGREPRAEDQRAQALLPAKSAGAYVNPDDYLPTLVEARPAETTRKAFPVTINGKPGIVTRKVFDSGRYQYGGPLQGLWVDQTAEENFQMVVGDPLSLVGFTQSTTILERPEQGFRARSETTTNVWSETDGEDGFVFRYRATVKTFIGDSTGTDRPFAEKTVSGEIARSWI